MGSRKRILLETLGTDLELYLKNASQYSMMDTIKLGSGTFVVTMPGMPKRVKWWIKENGTRVGQTTAGARPIYKLNESAVKPWVAKILNPNFNNPDAKVGTILFG